MVIEVDNGFTAEKDISAYTKAASQAKPVVLGFNRWVKKKKKIKRYQLICLDRDGHMSKERSHRGVWYIENEAVVPDLCTFAALWKMPNVPIIATEHSVAMRRTSKQICKKDICLKFWLLNWDFQRVSETSQEHLGHTKLMFGIYITGCFALRFFCVNEQHTQRQQCKSNSPEDNVTRPADMLRPCWIETSTAHSSGCIKSLVNYLKALECPHSLDSAHIFAWTGCVYLCWMQ